MKRNYRRRTIGAFLCLSPILLSATSLAFGIARENLGEISPTLIASGGLLFALVNFHLSVLRPRRHFHRHGSMDGFRNVSGAPMIGEISAVIANILGFGEVLPSALGLLTLLLDTGGSLWFLIVTWRDSGMWDAPSS